MALARFRQEFLSRVEEEEKEITTKLILEPAETFKFKWNTYMVEKIITKSQAGSLYKVQRRKKTMEDPVTIKVQDSINSKEVSILRRLAQCLDNSKTNVVVLYDQVIHRNRLCLIMEWMPTNLRDMITVIPGGKLAIGHTRMIIKELLTALVWLKEKGVIHGDINMSNVLVDLTSSGWRVKLCAFSTSFLRDEAHELQGFPLQSCVYTAPEILLGAPLTEAIDMWALGNMTASLVLGSENPLFPAKNPLTQLWLMTKLLENIPFKVLQKGMFTLQYFDPWEPLWLTKKMNLKSRGNIQKMVEDVELKRGFRTLDDLPNATFVDFLKKSLQMDPEKRVHPGAALNMAFFQESIFRPEEKV